MFNIKNPLTAERKSFSEQIKGLESKKFSDILRVLNDESEYIRYLIHKKDYINAIDYLDEYIDTSRRILLDIYSNNIANADLHKLLKQLPRYADAWLPIPYEYTIMKCQNEDDGLLWSLIAHTDRIINKEDMVDKYLALTKLERIIPKLIDILERKEYMGKEDNFDVRDSCNDFLYEKFIENFDAMSELQAKAKFTDKKYGDR